MHAGMSYTRLEELGGIQWPCWDDEDPGSLFIHDRLWADVVEERAPFQPVEHDPPVDALDDDFPLRLTTGRRLESFNTGVQTGGFSSPLHVGGEAILLAPEDGERYGVADGARVRVVSRRGSVEAPARYVPTLRPGLAFMNLHFPDEVATNVLTIDATDPKSGTAEFKATAIRLEVV
jgi:formate dehydrogenase major subunit